MSTSEVVLYKVAYMQEAKLAIPLAISNCSKKEPQTTNRSFPAFLSFSLPPFLASFPCLLSLPPFLASFPCLLSLPLFLASFPCLLLSPFFPFPFLYNSLSFPLPFLFLPSSFPLFFFTKICKNRLQKHV